MKSPVRHCTNLIVLLSDLSRQAHNNPSVNKTSVDKANCSLFCNSTKKNHSRLSRCGKSCRLRWENHLRPDLKKGAFTPKEERHIIELHAKMGNKWAHMAIEVYSSTFFPNYIFFLSNSNPSLAAISKQAAYIHILL
ncbi:unnamed protein product [Lactuca saligna]|uniref:HTH myb-type domain-containing protein n=1 Tax=Lactuca saligna TaxID=75948 RepID=A0AA36A271_LACSI|nr:unnamed protein product [Lactuca saligna]